MRRHSAIGVIVALALAAGVFSSWPATAATGSVSLDSTPSRVTYGSVVTLAGALETDAACLDGRLVRIQRLPAGAAAWEESAEASTDAEGSFAVELTPDASAAYRALVPSEDRGVVCEEIVSATTDVDVQASVRLRVPRPLRAGRCARTLVRVAPGKPGHVVELQRRRGDVWTPVGTGRLSDESTTSLSVCADWKDLGRIHLRARWPAQDLHNLEGVAPSTAVRVVKAGWMRRIDRLVAGRPIGVSVRDGGDFVYRRADGVSRIPASNEKLFLSMALLDALGPEARLPMIAAATKRRGTVIRGDLWILGRGDPGVRRGDLNRLAKRIRAAGIRRIRGSVRGSSGYFARDWWAPGWKRSFPGRAVALPTALTFEGNRKLPPELRVAQRLTKLLRARGVRVRGRPRTGRRLGGGTEIARAGPPLSVALREMNRRSVNFSAEVLGKRLGVARSGPPGTIAKGAEAIASWARGHGVRIRTNDGSGLSYKNRAQPAAIARLLEIAEALPWGTALRDSLPTGGQGTLRRRLRGVPVRAKTGTLDRISALSGWVRSARTGSWVEFSILSRGMSTSRAKAIEDRIVKTLQRNAG